MTGKNNHKTRSINDRTNVLLWKVTIVASLGGILFGFDTAVISGTFGMVENQFGLSKIQVGWFGSSALIGAIAGALTAGKLSDRYGRKPILLFAALLFFLSALFSSIPPDYFWLICARILGGIGVGMASVLSPLYISEFAPARMRGRLVAMYQFSIVVGILLAYFSNWLLLFFSDAGIATGGAGIWYKLFIAEVWRGMFAAEMLPSGLFFVLMLMVPESPRWLINQGREEKGWYILQRVDGTVERETMIRIERSEDEKLGIRALLRPGWRQALAVGVGLSVFGQFTGVNIVIYYGPSILERAGYGLDNAVQFQVLIGVINLIFTVFALLKIDSWGRRPLLIGGMISVFISLCGLGILFAGSESSGIWAVVILCIYIASLALSINAVIWVLIGEIYPTHIRGQAMSIATFANWCTNFAAALLFPWYVDMVGMGMGFFTFAGFTLLGIIFFIWLIPETKGKSLEEIELYWQDKFHIGSG